MISPGIGTQPTSRRAAGVLLAAALFVLPFPSTIALRNVLLATGAACAAVWIAQGGGVQPQLPPRRVLAPLLIFFAWCTASVAWSVDPAYSVSELRHGLIYPFTVFLVFFAVTTDVADLDRWAWSLCAGLAGLGIAAASGMAFSHTGDWQNLHGGAGSYATFVVLALPLLAWAFLRSTTGAIGTRTALAAVALLTVVVLASSDNRIAWVALAVMTVLAIILLRDRLVGPHRARVLAVVAVALISFTVLFELSIQQRTAKLEGSRHAVEAQLTSDPRLAIWDYAVRRIGEAPWSGHGYGREILAQQFRKGVVPGIDNPLYTHAHNTALNIALQAGFIGLAIFVWLIAALVREMAVALKSGPPARQVGVLGLVLVGGFAIRNLTDDYLVRHSSLIAWSLAGAVLGALRRPRTKGQSIFNEP